MKASILDLPSRRASGEQPGIVSVCSAHPLVIEAALLQARADNSDALIEATCNQVNQDGGYTGMTPADFRAFVFGIAHSVGFDHGRVILGGDHLGPNPWRRLPSTEAMDKAGAMVAAFVAAGFTKLHLDTSMGCKGEPAALDDAETARRAAFLAEIAEHTSNENDAGRLGYVVGTEVPIPGGATHVLDHVDVTRPEVAGETVAVHRAAFERRGLAHAFERVVGIVVQPGVEFGHDKVVRFAPERSRKLSAMLHGFPHLLFEAHSTDYQPADCLRALVEQGFAILKVGPGLTFALREALYGLDAIADVLDPEGGVNQLRAAMEREMLERPDDWQRHYAGTPGQRYMQRHFSYSDRIRYYWPQDGARHAVDHLMRRLHQKSIPETLVSQYLHPLYGGVTSGAVPATPRCLLIAAVRLALQPYSLACMTPLPR